MSAPDQADSGLSNDEQQTKIRAGCLENGWQLAGIFVDAGVSGGIPLGQRAEGDKLTVPAARLNRVDLGDAAVEHNLAYQTRRELSPEARARALLSAGQSSGAAKTS